MTGLTSPVSAKAAPPGKVAAPSLLAIGTPADVTPGAPSLAAFVDLMSGKTAVAAKQEQSGDDRQEDAAPGNALPEKQSDKGDPTLAWLFSVVPIALPPADPATSASSTSVGPAPVAASAGGAATLSLPAGLLAATDASDAAGATVQPAAVPSSDAQRQPAAAALSAGVPPSALAAGKGIPAFLANATRALAARVLNTPVPTAAAPISPASDPASASGAVLPTTTSLGGAVLAATLPIPTPVGAQPVAVPGTARAAAPAVMPKASIADRTGTVVPSQPVRVPLPPAATTPLVAAASGGTSMPAMFALAMTPDHDRPSDADPDSPTGIAAAAATLLSPTDAAALVAKPGGAQGQALDLGRQDWPQKMIDRIEALRDDANANDTSIRLKPDALGQVDVSLRAHADGAVSVRFTAEQPATRAMIAEATPQLTAAAEARGIRLAGTSVDLSGSGMAGGDRPRPQFEARQNTSNHLSATSGDDIQAVADGRIA